MKHIVLAVMLMVFSAQAWGDMIKEPNVAGGFYSHDPKELADTIDNFLASTGPVPQEGRIEVAIAPHAGYPYSGPIAAYTFKAINRHPYKTVVVIGPSHYFPFEGISVWAKGGLKTPLGVISVDEDLAGALLKENPQFQFLPQVFEREHSIEVELPFLQKTFKDVRIVPILMGNPDPKICRDLAVALDKIIGKREDVLVLVSSDMSHYYPYEAANRMDDLTLQAVKSVDPQKLFEGCMNRKMEMCGFVPVTTALMYAQLRGIKDVKVLKYANSGDTAGDKGKVVGYSAVAFYAPQQTGALNKVQQQELLTIARRTVETFVKTGKVIDVNVNDVRLKENEGAFVTIRKDGQLRGCIGNILGQGPLYKTVRDMAVASASQDPRFLPVTAQELDSIDLEISVLSKPQRVKDVSEIQLGKHGVIVSHGNRQGVFLPQVAEETGWNKEEFLSQLCSQKAGLPADAWKDPNVDLYVFTADVFEEKE